MSSEESASQSNSASPTSASPPSEFQARMAKVGDGDAVAICQLLEEFGRI